MCGLCDQVTQKSLLTEKNLTYQKAAEIARGNESAPKTTQ